MFQQQQCFHFDLGLFFFFFKLNFHKTYDLAAKVGEGEKGSLLNRGLRYSSSLSFEVCTSYLGLVLTSYAERGSEVRCRETP